MQNIAAAINNNPAQCGYVDPNSADGTTSGLCYYNGTNHNAWGWGDASPPQSYVTATVSGGNSVVLTANATGAGATAREAVAGKATDGPRIPSCRVTPWTTRRA
jgi:hypothetical protein